MILKKIFTLLLFACLSTTVFTAKAASVTEFLTSIAGTWESDQDAFGKPSHTTLRLESVLDGKFVHLEYTIRALNEESSFLGAAYYKQTDSNATTAKWFSNQGDILPINATIEAASIGGNTQTTMTSEWGELGKTFGKTTYTLIDKNKLEVNDWIHRDGEWRQFNSNQLTRVVEPTPLENGDGAMQEVTGIGGLFFRAKESSATADWYAKNLGVDLTPKDYNTQPWQQDAGPTVFAPFSEDTEYFGRDTQQWMVNFRVNDLDAMVAQLRASGNTVEVDPELYPNGRFARTHDPEGNPIELWEPLK